MHNSSSKKKAYRREQSARARGGPARHTHIYAMRVIARARARARARAQADGGQKERSRTARSFLPSGPEVLIQTHTG